MARNNKVNSQTVSEAKLALLNAYELQHEDDPVELPAAIAEQLIDIVVWCEERLQKQKENSRIYQKKASLLNKLIAEHLSPDELANINAQARKLADAE